MIEGFTGRVGSGKTYSMIERALREHAKGRTIFSNMMLPWVSVFDTAEDLIGTRNALVLLDEAGIWFSARGWAKMPEDVLSFFAQSRKHGCDLWFTAQHEGGVDTSIRRLVMNYWHCERYGSIIKQTCRDGQTLKKMLVRFTMLRPRVMEAYNTFEVVGKADGSGRGIGAAAYASIESWLEKLRSAWVSETHGCMVKWRRAEVEDAREGRPIFSKSSKGGFRLLEVPDEFADYLTARGQGDASGALRSA